MAFQHAQSTLGGDTYQADTTDVRVTSDPASGGIAFCSGFERTPLFFANIATVRVLRSRSQTTTAVRYAWNFWHRPP
jgi:hypothetical protein